MKDEIKEIEEWLRDISTPTGLSYSGDRTLSNSMVDHIIDYITNLQESEAYYYGQYKDYKSRNERANNILKDTNVDMPETLLIETIDYARHILKGEDKDE